MKANREHVVPLCNRAVAIVRRCAELRKPSCDLVFSGTKKGLPLSDMTLSKLLKLMQQPYTAHGFRSSFRDWVSEETNHPTIGRAHVCTPVTKAHLVCRLLLDKNKTH